MQRRLRQRHLHPVRHQVARIVGQFREMPGLCVTVREAARLWGMDLARCARLIRRLVAIGVLRPISRGRYVCV